LREVIEGLWPRRDGSPSFQSYLIANSTQRPLTCGLGRISIVESADLIGRHEHQCEFFVVFEVDTPDGEALRVEAIWTQSIPERRGGGSILLVESFEGSIGPTRVLVRVRSFPVLEVECWFWEIVE
jgi:hypothetical protein